jgi:sulfur-oxidizing protein SoxZ
MSTIRVRASAEGDVVKVQCLIQHPMDSGFIKDAAGKTIPPHFIETLQVQAGDKPVFTAFWGPAVSKDPFLSFSYKGGKSGDTLTFSWVDNEGQSDHTTAKVA